MRAGPANGAEIVTVQMNCVQKSENTIRLLSAFLSLRSKIKSLFRSSNICVHPYQ